MTVNVNDMKERFVALDRDYFTYDGLNTLLDCYDEIDENMEFDPIAICCACTEYGEGGQDTGADGALSFDDLIDEYEYKYPIEEYLEDNGLEEDEFDKDSYIESLVKHLEKETTILHVSNGNYIVFEF